MGRVRQACPGDAGNAVGRRATAHSSSRRTRTSLPVPRPTVVFERIDGRRRRNARRGSEAIYVDPKDSNHAWITYERLQREEPSSPAQCGGAVHPGRVDIHDARWEPAARRARRHIPATSLAVSDRGTVSCRTDYGSSRPGARCVAARPAAVYRTRRRGSGITSATRRSIWPHMVRGACRHSQSGRSRTD